VAAVLEPVRPVAVRAVAAVSRLDLPLLDGLRIVASIAVVRHHMRRDFLFGVGFGLPLFLVIMFALVAGSSRNESVSQLVRRKARYLLVPWVRWSLIYIAIFLVADVWRGISPWSRFEPGMMFFGGEESLWFLPFAACALLPLKWLGLRVGSLTPWRAAWIAAVLGLVATCAATWAVTQPIPDMPVRTWLRVAPAIFWGLAVGQSVRAQSDRERGAILVVVSILAVAASLVSAARNPAEDLPLRFAVAVPLACLGFGWRVSLPASMRRLATATFGVYLVHPLIGSLLEIAVDVSRWPASLHAGAAWVLSILLVLVLRRCFDWHELNTGRVSARGRLETPQTVSGRAP